MGRMRLKVEVGVVVLEGAATVEHPWPQSRCLIQALCWLWILVR